MRCISIRELTDTEISQVSGAGDLSVGDTMALGGGIGGGVGLSVSGSLGLDAAGRLTAAGLGTGYGLALTGAALAGWHAGQWLNENTPIQSWISDAIDGDE